MKKKCLVVVAEGKGKRTTRRGASSRGCREASIALPMWHTKVAWYYYW